MKITWLACFSRTRVVVSAKSSFLPDSLKRKCRKERPAKTPWKNGPKQMELRRPRLKKSNWFANYHVSTKWIPGKNHRKFFISFVLLFYIISSLLTLANCVHLSLSSNGIDKIANLNGLKKLKILVLSRNNIKNLNGLDAVGDTLEQLWISNNNIEKLKGVHVLKKLKVLYIANNGVKVKFLSISLALTPKFRIGRSLRNWQICRSLKISRFMAIQSTNSWRPRENGSKRKGSRKSSPNKLF